MSFFRGGDTGAQSLIAGVEELRRTLAQLGAQDGPNAVALACMNKLVEDLNGAMNEETEQPRAGRGYH